MPESDFNERHRDKPMT